MLRKPHVPAFLLALLLLSASSAFAAGSYMIGANAGMRSFTGDASDWKSGLLLGVSGDYMLNDSWAVGADFSYNTSKHKDDGQPAAPIYPSLTGTISDELKTMEYGVHAKYFFPMKQGPVHPYLVAGAGYYSLKEEFSAGSFSETATASKPGFRGGVGATWMADSQWGIGAEADYHMVSTEGSSTSFYGVSASVCYHVKSK